MGVDPELARGAVRFSLGAGNIPPQIDEFLKALKSVVTRLRNLTAIAV
jgi:cysteine desulfurase